MCALNFKLYVNMLLFRKAARFQGPFGESTHYTCTTLLGQEEETAVEFELATLLL